MTKGVEDGMGEPPRIEGRHRFMAGTCVDCGRPLDEICTANLQLPAAVPEAKPEPPATKSACDKWPSIPEFLPAYPGARNQHPDFTPPHPPANPLFPQEERPRSQGLCDTTSTERFENPDCVCPTYEGNLGPCAKFEGGGNSRCVYCDHELSCHLVIGKRFMNAVFAAPKVMDSKEGHGEDELLSCPFCGGEPRWGESADGGHFIECSKCGGTTNLTYFLMDDASRDVRERWNKRAK